MEPNTQRKAKRTRRGKRGNKKPVPAQEVELSLPTIRGRARDCRDDLKDFIAIIKYLDQIKFQDRNRREQIHIAHAVLRVWPESAHESSNGVQARLVKTLIQCQHPRTIKAIKIKAKRNQNKCKCYSYLQELVADMIQCIICYQFANMSLNKTSCCNKPICIACVAGNKSGDRHNRCPQCRGASNLYNPKPSNAYTELSIAMGELESLGLPITGDLVNEEELINEEESTNEEGRENEEDPESDQELPNLNTINLPPVTPDLRSFRMQPTYEDSGNYDIIVLD